MTNTDKRSRADLFRTRLAIAMGERGVSQSALARDIKADRSTISQLLSGHGARLPNAQIVGECAAQLRVSADWLLGLSDRPESAADLVKFSLTMTEAPRTPVDEQINGWHKEARGYKIRHVPAGLPDLLKTRAVLEWEYQPHLGRTTEQAIGASEDRLQFMQESRSDYEIAFPAHEITSFARAEGYYAGLPAALRIAQIDQILGLYGDLYPTLRIYLYDARRIYSSPVTVFGPLLAVLYVGGNYISFRDSERVQTLTRHFDNLVREADVTDRDLVGFLQRLRDEMTS
jgi:transcriptional regulator with XRE-family HTH domain